MTLSIDFPEDIVEILGVPASEVDAVVKADLAVFYYEKGLISIGKAAELSGVGRGGFENLLTLRGSTRNYSIDD